MHPTGSGYGNPYGGGPSGPGAPQGPPAGPGGWAPPGGFAPQGGPPGGQASGAMPPGIPEPPGGPQVEQDPVKLMGFALEPGERLVFFRMRDVEAKKRELLILGLVTLPIFLIGLIFLIQAATAGRLPKVVAITTFRLVLVASHGTVQSYWLRDIQDFWAVRQEANTSGQGALGAAIGAAIVHGMNAANAAKPKTDPNHWGRCTGITLIDHGRREMTLQLTEDTGAVGPVLSQLQAGWGDRMPSVDPRVAARTAAPSPTVVGRMERIVGTVAVLPACFIMYRLGHLVAWNGFDVDNHLSGVIVGALFLGGGVALYAWGTKKAQKAIAAGATPKRNLMVGHPILGGLIAVGLALGIWEYVRTSEIKDDTADRWAKTDGGRKPASGSSTNGPSSATAPFTKERIAAVAAKRGLTLDGPSDSKLGDAPWYTVSVNGASPNSLYVEVLELDKALKTSSSDAHAFGATGSHAVFVRASGPGAQAEADAIKAQLLTKLINSARGIVGILKARGYKNDPPDADGDYTFGRRQYLVFADKGETHVTVSLLDYSATASGKPPGTAFVIGNKIALVCAEYYPGYDTKALASEIAAR